MWNIFFCIRCSLSPFWMLSAPFGSTLFSPLKFHALVHPSCCRDRCPASNCFSCILLFLHMTFYSPLSVLDVSTTLYHFPSEYPYGRTNKKPLCGLAYLTIKKLIVFFFLTISLHFHQILID